MKRVTSYFFVDLVLWWYFGGTLVVLWWE